MSRFALRDYQSAGTAAIREKYRAGFRAPILVAPTGSGKTVMGCSLMEQALVGTLFDFDHAAAANTLDAVSAERNVVMFLAHRKELINQCWKKLKDNGIRAGVIKADDWRTDYSRPVQVASVQTLSQRLTSHRLCELPVRLLMIDEAHHATAASYRKILDAYKSARGLGLTATPYRSDGKGLGGEGGIFDSFVEVASLSKLIDMGFLVPPRVFTGSAADDSGIRMVGNDYDQGELARRSDTPTLIGDIVRHWFRHAEGRKTIAFGVNRAHAMHIRDLFIAAGIKAEYVDGDTPDTERDRVLDPERGAFTVGDTMILCNVGIATEGYDCPACSAVILARRTKSRCLWRQMVGRGMRPAPGKSDFIVLDHAECDAEHGWVLDPDEISLESVKKKQRPGGERDTRAHCPNADCGAVFPWARAVRDMAGGLVCPYCQTLLKRPGEAARIEVDASRDLAEVDQAQRRRDFYRKTAEDGYRAGWKPIAVNLRFKDRFKEWPTEADREGAPIRTGWHPVDTVQRIWCDAAGSELPAIRRAGPRQAQYQQSARK